MPYPESSVATGPIIRPTLRIPKRKCLGCGYPIIISSPPQCPECGREYNPADLSTTGAVAPEDRTVEYRLGPMAGLLSIPVAFVALYTIQYAVMGWWNDTTEWLWWNGSSRRYGAWWELEGIGHWLWYLQMLVFLLLSILFGIFMSRLTIIRHYRHDRA